jgi:hypothetical protein
VVTGKPWWHAAADYATSEAYPQWPGLECTCGAAGCRGVVRWDDWKLPEMQVKYAGHFLMHVARQVARTHLKVRVLERDGCAPA